MFVARTSTQCIGSLGWDVDIPGVVASAIAMLELMLMLGLVLMMWLI